MMMEIDWSVGQIMDVLERKGVADDTVLCLRQTMVPGYHMAITLGIHPIAKQREQALMEGHVRHV